ncbi:two-component response regulator ARR14-like [Solanum verrucosum]|uniref:two-component response regulator ARR14-like n=1 Tax=Solanum verrucosum TaxID=315347 RepID=UPI0020D1ED6A|nr:two-component response regulator ARR14-like [Solanum verrucosum]
MEVENSEKFRILVVDDDINCLLTTTASLKNLKFEVMTVNNIEVALGGLRSSGLSFDLLLIDVHMLKMDVFQFQQEIAKEFDIPVAFMSNDEKDNTLMKGLDNRAVFFIVKPITQDNINYLWEYATSLRNKKHTSKQEFEENPNDVIYIESSSSVSERDKSTRKYDDVENHEDASSKSSKTSRIIWTDSLHNKFLEAIAILGVKKAYPKKILELMNIPELSRKHIASHLQKYRMRLEKNAIPELILNSKNLNYADHDTETDLRGFMSDYEKDREFSNILSRHLNQKPCNLQGNHEGINAAEIPLHLGNVLPNSASEQGKYACITAEERPLHFSNVSPILALEVVIVRRCGAMDRGRGRGRGQGQGRAGKQPLVTIGSSVGTQIVSPEPDPAKAVAENAKSITRRLDLCLMGRERGGNYN